MKDLPITRLMTRPLVTIAPSETLVAATSLMETRDVHHLLVLEGDRMVGILSSADLLKLALMAPTPAEALDSVCVRSCNRASPCCARPRA